MQNLYILGYKLCTSDRKLLTPALSLSFSICS